MPLSDRQIKAAKPKDKPYRLSDEKALYLEITPAGGKYWRMKYRIHGKEKRLAIGVYPDVSLADARTQRDEARKLLARGIDPSTEKQARRVSSRAAAGNSFEVIAREWFAARMADKSESHRKRTLRSLEMYLFPTIGRRPITEITPLELLGHLRKIEGTGKIETARRCKQAASAVFRYGVVTGRCERDPAGDLKDALQTPVKRHFAAITDPAEFGKLLLAMDAYTGTPVVRAALQCSALWFCRPGELRRVEWAQVNWDAEQIEITAEKTDRPHIIPLSRQSLAILRELEPITGRSKYVFPSARGGSRCMSENTVNVAIRSLGYDRDQMTAHGFRAAARTMLDEVLNYRIEWIEQQLAHEVRDANGRSYNRTAHLKQRREMLQHWADFLDQLRKAASSTNVISASFCRQA
jgi:integrase